MEEQFSWHILYSYRQKVYKKYPSVYGLKIRKKLYDVVSDELRDGIKILDVGANTRSLGDKIVARVPTIIYKTMDIDRAMSHDYYSLQEIHESFDIIILAEVIEHLDLKEGISMLHDLHALLNENGVLILTTPNIYHPNRFWHDSDHKTPYSYAEIGGALLSVGFSISKMYRTYNDQFFRRLFRMYVACYLHKYLDVDFAKSIVVVASKK